MTVIKGSNVLNLQDDINAYQTRLPTLMTELDRSLVLAHVQAHKVQWLYFAKFAL